MFDKHIRQWDTYTSKVVAVTKEIEKTISPDKVTEMYDAVKEEVKKSLIRTYVIETDLVNGVVMDYHELYTTWEKVIVVRFNLNWKEFIFEKRIKYYERIGLSDLELVDIFFEFYKAEIAIQIIRPIVENLVKNSK